MQHAPKGLMGFFKAVLGMVSPRLRVDQNIENFVGYYRSISDPGVPPCVSLYDTWMKMTRFGVNPRFRTAPVVNALCSFYSCLTPPNSIYGLAHQWNYFTETPYYVAPDSRPAKEWQTLMRELDPQDYSLIPFDSLKARFRANNGADRVTCPRDGIVFEITLNTVWEFESACRDGAQQSPFFQ